MLSMYIIQQRQIKELKLFLLSIQIFLQYCHIVTGAKSLILSFNQRILVKITLDIFYFRLDTSKIMPLIEMDQVSQGPFSKTPIHQEVPKPKSPSIPLSHSLPRSSMQLSIMLETFWLFHFIPFLIMESIFYTELGV